MNFLKVKTILTYAGLVLSVLAIVLMVAGHFGNHHLNWMANQISTYAATAPYDFLISASMLLAASTLLVIGFISSRFQLFERSNLAHFIPMLAGAAAVGLVVLACFEETAMNLSLLRKSGFMAIRIQSFHDAGLLIFYYGSIMLVALLGVLIVKHGVRKVHRLLGVLILSLAPVSYSLMTTRWPKAIGLDGAIVGLNQRAALFCLWLALTLTLAMAVRNSFHSWQQNSAVE